MDRILNIKLSEVMGTKPVTISIDAVFSRTEELFKQHSIRHLPVVDKHNILRGVITQTDLYRTVSPMKSMEGDIFYTKELLDRYILKHAMTKKILVLHPEDTLESAMQIMIKKRYGCIPIVDKENHLVGIVTQIDILQAIFKHAGWVC
jgi:acetoin utilization protein AcuB